MTLRTVLPAILLVAGLGGCAPSPLYVANPKSSGTFGEVPRDGRGEPVWTSIRPPVPLPPPPPPQALPNPGIPVTPPAQN